MPIPTAADFALSAVLSDAFYLITQTQTVVIFAIGVGIGVLVIGLIMRALKEAL